MKFHRFVLAYTRRLLALPLLATPVVAEGDVWVVDADAGPGAHFTDITDAYWATESGDVLLVRPGFYQGMFVIADDRELTLVADGPNVTVRNPYFVVRNLSAEKRVVVRGFDFVVGSIWLENNAGTVWMEDCMILADMYSGSGEVAALVAWNSKLVLQNAYVHGSMTYGFHRMPPTAGISLWRSTASIANVFIVGGEGRDTSFPDFPGAHAIDAYDSTVSITNGHLVGGAGYTQPGGSGLALQSRARGWTRAVTAGGGSGSPAGQPVMVDASSAVTATAGGNRALSTVSTARKTLSVAVQGTPGDAVILSAGLEPALDLGRSGTFSLVEPGHKPSVFLGVIPASGVLKRSLALPELGVYGPAELFLQARHLGLSRGSIRTRNDLGPGSAVLVLGDDP